MTQFPDMFKVGNGAFRKNNQLSYWADLRDWRIGQNGNQDRSYISDFDRFNSGNDDDTPLLPFDIEPKE